MIQTLQKIIQSVDNFLPTKKLVKDFNTTKNNKFYTFLFCARLNMKHAVMHASYATHIKLMQQVTLFLETFRPILPALLAQTTMFVDCINIFNSHNSGLFKHFTGTAAINFKY